MIYELREYRKHYDRTMTLERTSSIQQPSDEDAVAAAKEHVRQVTDDRLIVLVRAGESRPLAELPGLIGIGQGQSWPI